MQTCPCNIQKIFGYKDENFPWKNFDIFLIFAQKIDCGQECNIRTYIFSLYLAINKINKY